MDFGKQYVEDFNGDPFITIGRLKEVLIADTRRSPVQRIAAARRIFREYDAAQAAKKKAGKTFYLGAAP